MSEQLSEQRMDIFLLAAPQAGIEHAVLVSNLAAAFKKDTAAIEKMLSRPRTMVKADVTPEIAGKYKVLIEKSGGQCELVVREPAVAVASPEEAAPVHAEEPVIPLAAPIPAVTPVPAVAPDLTAVSQPAVTPVQTMDAIQAETPSEAKVSLAAEASVQTETAIQPKVSQPADSAETLDKSEFAQLQALASESLAAESHGESEVKAEQDSSAQHDGEGSHSDATCYCVKCGTVIRVGQTQCPKCFTPVTEYQSKHKTVASLLAFFLGGLGLHRLYLGQWWGVLYLVFLWTLIPIVVAVIEAGVFWFTPKKKWDAKYGRVQKSSALLAGVFVVAFVVLIMFIGMLAAIAIPAYQDYTYRAKVQASMPLVQNALNKVATHIKQTQTYPNDNQMVGLPEKSGNGFIESINLQDGAIVEVVYWLYTAKESHTILWIPTENKGEIAWDCKRGTLPDKYRPRECRSGNTPVNRELEKSAAETVLSQKLYSEDKHVSLLVPITWEVKELLPGAAIAAAKLLDENYVVVLADPKVNFDENITLADYSRTVQLQLADNIKNGMVEGEVEYLTVAGFPAEQFIFPGVVGGVKISYVVTLIEGDSHFYRVLGWTLQSRMDKNRKLLKNISESIKIH